jgi:hypothetical protein
MHDHWLNEYYSVLRPLTSTPLLSDLSVRQEKLLQMRALLSVLIVQSGIMPTALETLSARFALPGRILQQLARPNAPTALLERTQLVVSNFVRIAPPELIQQQVVHSRAAFALQGATRLRSPLPALCVDQVNRMTYIKQPA